MGKSTGVQKWVCVAVLLAGGAIAAPAGAISGSIQAYSCKTVEPANSTASYGLVRGAGGLVNTDSAHAKTVFCPIERNKNVGASASHTSALSAFKVYFKNPSNNFLCSLSSEDSFGNVQQSYVRNSGPSPYDFGSSLTSSGDLVTFNMYCSIGPSNTLLSYVWTET